MIYGTLATMFFHDGMSTKRKRSRTFSLYTYELNREAVNTVPKRMTSRVKLLKFKSNFATHLWCDLDQVALFLCASVSLSVKWE